ncbi:MAG TPA: SPOR domain-containing protein [Kofleriaceae bacterium]|nr:SPOR domain-containing protein [Kofleriaceae bacterium]
MSREEGLYKDKIEVSLDGRQIFYLFFGGSVIVGLVFVLGVMVGRRVEARGHVERAQTQAAVDPLAALDRLEGGGLSYQGSLRGGDAPASDVEKTIGEMAKQKAAPAKKGEAKAKDEPKLAEAPKLEPKAEPKLEIKDLPKAEAKPEAKAEAKPEAKSEAKPEAKPEKKTRFALQLSSFQDKAEAQAYLEQVKANGLPAYVTEADVDGKTFYRVRVGKYASIDAASDAKVDIDKATKKSATVVKL